MYFRYKYWNADPLRFLCLKKKIALALMIYYDLSSGQVGILLLSTKTSSRA